MRVEKSDAGEVVGGEADAWVGGEARRRRRKTKARWRRRGRQEGLEGNAWDRADKGKKRGILGGEPSSGLPLCGVEGNEEVNKEVNEEVNEEVKCILLTSSVVR